MTLQHTQLINLWAGTSLIDYLETTIGALSIHSMYTLIDITTGTIGLLTIHMILDGAGIDGIIDGGTYTIGIDLTIIGTIGISDLGKILLIMWYGILVE